MSTTNSGFEDDEQHEHREGSPAVRRAGAGAGAGAWRAALDAQQTATSEHQDFHGLTRELVVTLGSIAELMRVVSRQVGGYADGLPDGQRVYDDSREVDPHELPAKAAGVLVDISTKVGWSALEMNRFWSLIGCIGVEDAPPDVTSDVTP